MFWGVDTFFFAYFPPKIYAVQTRKRVVMGTQGSCGGGLGGGGVAGGRMLLHQVSFDTDIGLF
jgi:hypothetical protein